jgi:hypothetical protein
MALVDSASNKNEYREYLLGVRAAGVYGLRCHLHVPIVYKFWQPQPSGLLTVRPGLYIVMTTWGGRKL